MLFRSLNIALDGNFAQWVGEMIKDIKQKIVLITYPEKEIEAITRLARVGYDGACGYLTGGFQSWKDSGKKINIVNRISAAYFEKVYEAKPLIFDVRKKSEFDSEHVETAINVPLNQIHQNFSAFPKEKPFILHCAGGYRSMIAASILKQHGWNNFSDVKGGFIEIKKTTVPRTKFVLATTYRNKAGEI